MTWLIVGLGNAPEKYHRTRHNAGYWFVDALAENLSASFQNHKLSALLANVNIAHHSVRIIKPKQYMNHSGISVAEFVHYYQIALDKIIICHDELDFLPGVIKFKQGGSSAGHNGIKDIARALGSDQFLRLRIGIGRENKNISGKDFVLSECAKEERIDIERGFIKAIESVKIAIDEGKEKAMLHLHSH